MDKEHIKGAADKAKGAVKDAAGKVMDDKELQAEGKMDKAKGAARRGAGRREGRRPARQRQVAGRFFQNEGRLRAALFSVLVSPSRAARFGCGVESSSSAPYAPPSAPPSLGGATRLPEIGGARPSLSSAADRERTRLPAGCADCAQGQSTKR